MKKKFSQPYSITKSFGYVKIRSIDLVNLIKLLENNNVKDIKIEDSEYEYDLKDLDKLDKLDNLKIYGKTENGYLTIRFSYYGNNEIYLNKYSIYGKGLVDIINEELNKYNRFLVNFLKRKFGYIFFFLLSIYIIFYALRNYIGYNILLIVLAISSIYSYILFNVSNKLIIKENFFIRNKDTLLVSVFSAIIGGIAILLMQKIFNI